MKLNKILCLGIIATSAMSLNVQVFADNINESKNIEILSETGIDSDCDNDITPYSADDIYYFLEDETIDNGKTSYTKSVKLTNAQPYGKAFFVNNTNQKITMYVTGDDTDKELIISPKSQGAITWKKTTSGSQNYKVTLRSSTTTINGRLSIARWNKNLTRNISMFEL